jgi:hypothetical protein
MFGDRGREWYGAYASVDGDEMAYSAYSAPLSPDDHVLTILIWEKQWRDQTINLFSVQVFLPTC